MNTAKLFKNGKSQAVRLPKQFKFQGTEVYIKRIGRNVILIPKDDPMTCKGCLIDWNPPNRKL